MSNQYSVSLWGSDPDTCDNDDCWTGEDFPTKEEAQAFFQAVLAAPYLHPMAKGCGHWEYIELDGPDVHVVAPNPDQETCARHRRDLAREDRAWRWEVAVEAGMLHGTDAYNEEMGY